MTQPARQRLFTPGPLNTSEAVRSAMLRDMGSRDPDFLEIVRTIRRKLLAIASARPQDTAVLVQGSGTFAIESAIGSLLPKDGKLLVPVNGAYGQRMAAIARRLGIAVETIECPETEPNDPAAVAARLATDAAITHVAAVHCETSSGVMNPIAEIGAVVAAAGRQFLVDAMSSFGGLPVDISGWRIDCLVSSANKCLEGAPGLAFAIVRTTSLEASRGCARSLSLDLHAQWQELERSGQFRFTPPTHVILALAAALDALAREGGATAREQRYRHRHRMVMTGMEAMGFQPGLRPELRSPIITAFHTPADPRFDFGVFYQQLVRRDLLIYPGKLSGIDSFRIGTIGALTTGDFTDLLDGIRAALDAMNVVMHRP